MERISFASDLVLFIGAEAQTTAFTYQGNLVVAGVSANGNYDFQFSPFGVEEFYLLAESGGGRLRSKAE